MKKLLRYSVVGVLVLSMLAINSCKDENVNGPDKRALLTAHIWNFNGLTTTSTDTDVLLLVNLMAVLMTNGTCYFASDGTYTLTIPAIEETDTGTWELSSDGTKLTFDPGTAGETTDDIVTLTSDVLEFVETVSEEGYAVFNATFRWVK